MRYRDFGNGVITIERDRTRFTVCYNVFDNELGEVTHRSMMVYADSEDCAIYEVQLREENEIEVTSVYERNEWR